MLKYKKTLFVATDYVAQVNIYLKYTILITQN